MSEFDKALITNSIFPIHIKSRHGHVYKKDIIKSKNLSISITNNTDLGKDLNILISKSKTKTKSKKAKKVCKCIGKILAIDENIITDIVIEDFLNRDHTNLSFKLIDVDLDIINKYVKCNISQDKKVSVYKLSIINLGDRKYLVEVHSNKPFKAGKISMNFIVSSKHKHCIYPPCGCRPGSYIDQKIRNPFK
jgi:hypothetical protein